MHAVRSLGELFAALDADGDGALSRADLRERAVALGWHWPEAPIYALLDLLTIAAPLGRHHFEALMAQVLGDPFGPYGEALRQAPRPRAPGRPAGQLRAAARQALGSGAPAAEALESLIARALDERAAEDYRALVAERCQPVAALDPAESALLVIDPQRSFTTGVWARSAGRGFELDVAPLGLAFRRVGDLLGALPAPVPALFTRCPFPPASYDWDDAVDRVLAPSQLYFLKPGNSVLWPPTNGFADWVASWLAGGGRTLLVAGCTLNSCVRVSALELQEQFGGQGLALVVHLGAAGARLPNYARSGLYGGRSSVAAAIGELVDAGITVAERVRWS